MNYQEDMMNNSDGKTLDDSCVDDNVESQGEEPERALKKLKVAKQTRPSGV